MNKTHCLIWSDASQTWLVAHEAAATCGKPASRKQRLLNAFSATLVGALFAGAAHAGTPLPSALPSGAQIASGQATISQTASSLTVLQASEKAILNWQSFNIGSNASVVFQQPSASSVALNRVVGGSASQINGQLSSNGQVFLINPSGVLFGSGARVNVGGLVASSLDIADDDFLAGKYRFNRSGASGSIENQGELNAAYIALLAPSIRNEGIIIARQGSVAMAAGEAVTLGISGNALIDVQVDKASIDTLVENKHLIQTNGGSVILSAQSANSLLGQVVNSGNIDASGLESNGGSVRLVASSSITHSGAIHVDAASVGAGGQVIAIADLANSAGSTNVSGSISAKGGSEFGNGGFIETSASHLTIADSARITTAASHGVSGQWLLDPNDFTIAASGGDITGSALATALASGNVTIQTTSTTASCTGVACGSGSNGNGDIYVNDAISYGANTLTLNAWRNIDITGKVSVTNTGGLALQYGQSAVAAGNAAMLRVGPSVDLASTASYSSKFGSNGAIKTYTVITSLGAQGSSTGTDLQGITNLSGNYVLGADINAGGTSGWNAGAGFTPIGLGSTFTGSLEGLGHSISGLAISRTDNAKTGLVSEVGSGGIVQNVHLTNANVSNTNTSGNAYVGILAGRNVGVIRGVTTSGTLSSAYLGGGVVGAVGSGGVLELSSSSASVSGSDFSYIGGLVGLNYGTVRNVFATGSVTGTGATGPGGAAGLIGDTGFGGSTLTNGYARGAVTGTGSNKRGLVAAGSGTVTNSYYNSTTTGQSDTFLGSAPLTSAQMLQQSSFTGWDFASLWQMGSSGPVFKLGSAIQNLYVRLIAGNSIYGTTPALSYALYDAVSGGSVVSLGSTSGSVAWDTSLTATSNVGIYSLTYTGSLVQSGYAISAGSATSWTISPKVLSIGAGTAAGKIYDSTSIASITAGTLSGLIGAQTLALTASGNFDSANAGSRTATISYSLGDGSNGGLASNYSLANTTATATIAPKALTIGASTAAGKIYDGTSTASITAGTLSGLIGAQTLALTASGNFDSANAGSRTATISYSLGDGSNGGLASNYSLANTTATATITPKALSIGASTAAGKTYDGTTTASITAGTLSGLIGAQTLALTASGNFDSANAGSRTATISYSLGDGSNGGLASNYSLATITNATAAATITARNVSVTADSLSMLTGSTVPTLTYKVAAATANTGLVTGEVLGGAPATTATSASPMGSYSITQGRLTNANNSNYNISFTGNTLTVKDPYFTGSAISKSQTIANIGTITGGNADFTLDTSVANTVKFTQTAANGLYLIWSDLTLPTGYTLNFNQLTTGTQRGTHNNITSTNASQIQGKLVSNGPVYFYNPSGVIFASGASVDVQSLAAIALKPVIPEDYTGSISYTGTAGQVKNQAQLTLGLANGIGQSLLRGSDVINDGRLTVAGNGSLTLQADGKETPQTNGSPPLVAKGNIAINAPITLAGSGALALNYTGDYQIGAPVNLGRNNTFSTNGAPYTVITDLAGLRAMTASFIYNKNFAIGADINASATSAAPFSKGRIYGTFAGLGHVVTNLQGNGFIDRLDGLVRDIGLPQVAIKNTNCGQCNTGGLVADNNGTIFNSYVSGSVVGSDGASTTGGLAGYNYFSTISNSYFIGAVSRGGGESGGLVGINYSGTVSNSYASGAVNGGNGLVGNNLGTISNSYASSGSERFKQSTYAGFDFVKVWAIDEGSSVPYLRGLPRPTVPLFYSTVAAALTSALATPATLLAQNSSSAQTNAQAAAAYLAKAHQGAWFDSNSQFTSAGLSALWAMAFAKQAIIAACPLCNFSETDYQRWALGI